MRKKQKPKSLALIRWEKLIDFVHDWAFDHIPLITKKIAEESKFVVIGLASVWIAWFFFVILIYSSYLFFNLFTYFVFNQISEEALAFIQQVTLHNFPTKLTFEVFADDAKLFFFKWITNNYHYLITLLLIAIIVLILIILLMLFYFKYFKKTFAYALILQKFHIYKERQEYLKNETYFNLEDTTKRSDSPRMRFNCYIERNRILVLLFLLFLISVVFFNYPSKYLMHPLTIMLLYVIYSISKVRLARFARLLVDHLELLDAGTRMPKHLKYPTYKFDKKNKMSKANLYAIKNLLISLFLQMWDSHIFKGTTFVVILILLCFDQLYAWNYIKIPYTLIPFFLFRDGFWTTDFEVQYKALYCIKNYVERPRLLVKNSLTCKLDPERVKDYYDLYTPTSEEVKRIKKHLQDIKDNSHPWTKAQPDWIAWARYYGIPSLDPNDHSVSSDPLHYTNIDSWWPNAPESVKRGKPRDNSPV